MSAMVLVSAEFAYSADTALAAQAERCGVLLEQAMAEQDRELALIWQAAMVGIVQLRRSRRFGVGTQLAGVSHGG